MNHPLLYATCPLFVSLCDSVQTYFIILPTEAVWQPDQLHFDDAWACLSRFATAADGIHKLKGSNEACGHWKH